jgi:WD40 repeat protein
MELEYARLLGKRVIPINQMANNIPEKKLPEGNKQALIKFYKSHNLPDQNICTTQDVVNRSRALIGKTDWLAGQEKLSAEDCQHLAQWAQPYENNWAKHEDLDYLKSFEFPVFGETIDALDGVVERIIAVLERQKSYVHRHTEILTNALHWQKNQKATQHLLVNKKRNAAEDWLLTEFLPPKQPPCQPSKLVCEFICEARKNAENLMTDIFICYDIHHDKAIRNSVIQSLSRYAKTTWRHDCDIQKGADYEHAIEMGIENADNFFYFISPHSITSDYCQSELEHALKYNKRIVPLLIEPTPKSDTPEVLRGLQYVDFTDNTCQADYDSDIDDILNILRLDHEYYEQHKVLLARALKWESENRKSSFLLRGHNLDKAKTWLRLNDKREQHPPLPLHKELITTSEAAKGQLGTDVFVSYSRKDADFARRLNTALQEAGKTTWFDQESISTGVDFENEIFKGIRSADNFLFILSADAVESEYCEREVNYASEQSKRFISVLYREVDPVLMPEALRVINWIDFKDVAFDKSFPELIQAIDLDREHTHQHTLLQQRAIEWDENSQSSDFLLNTIACISAEQWLKTANVEHKQPAPTKIQQDFIQQSRAAIKAAERKERNRRKMILASVTGGMVVAIILAIVAVLERNNAQESEQKRTSELFESQLTHASLLTQNENYADSKKILEKTYPLDNEILAPGRHARNLLNRFNHMMGNKPQQIYRGANEQLETIAISPDGLSLVVGGENGALVVFDVKTGKLQQRLQGHQETIFDMVFHPQGKWLATIEKSGKRILFWSLSTGKITHEWPVSDVTALAIDADGTYLASNSNNNINLWNLKTSKPQRTLIGHEKNISKHGLTFHPTKPVLASVSEGKIAFLWNVSTGEKLYTFQSVNKDASITFSPNGKYLVAGCKSTTICFWEVDSGQLWKELQGHKNKVLDSQFIANGRYLVSASLDRTLRFWDIESGVTLRVLQEHTSGVSAIATHAEQVFSASYDNTAMRWDTALPYQHHIDLPNHGAYSLAMAPNNDVVAVGFEDGTLHLYSLAKSHLFWEQKAHNGTIFSLVFSPDKRLLVSTSLDKTAKLWQFKAGQLKAQKTFTHSSPVAAAAFSPDNQTLATALTNGQIGLFNIETEQERFYPAHKEISFSVNFGASNTRLVSGGADGYTYLWNLNDDPPTLAQTFPKTTSDVLWTSISPDSQLVASVGRDPVAHIYATNNAQKNPLRLLVGHENSVYRVAFSPDSNQVATLSSDMTVRFWDLSNDNILFTSRLPIKSELSSSWLDFDFSCTSQGCWMGVLHNALPKLLWYELGIIYE